MTLAEIHAMRQTCRTKLEDLIGRTSSREMSTEENQMFNDLKAEGERLASLESRYAVLESFDKGTTQPVVIHRPIATGTDRAAAISKALDSFLRTGTMAALLSTSAAALACIAVLKAATKAEFWVWIWPSSPAAKITALEITGISMNKRPALAPIGSGDLNVTLTDPTSGFQETIKTAFNPDAFWSSVTVADGQTIEDAVQVALFSVLTANKATAGRHSERRLIQKSG